MSSFAVICAVLELVDKYGVPAVREIIKTWENRTDITVEDVEALKEKIRHPDTYAS